MMTIKDTVHYFSDLSKEKVENLHKNPVGFLISSLMAGAYVGIGILLIFSVGQVVDPSIRNLVMGASFGIALTLIVFAGADLFTGHTMYASIGRLTKACSTIDAIKIWATTWAGNLIGSLGLAILFIIGGGGVVLQEAGDGLLHLIAYKKMSGTAAELIARGMLCNWLVCLAIWGAA
ncbi:MAG: formate/nitrite transporter family protein, partial [Rhizobiales bacterium]|nr:formate/nitrite transporter family protein [Hyphomicrobiales bacterium]